METPCRTNHPLSVERCDGCLRSTPRESGETITGAERAGVQIGPKHGIHCLTVVLRRRATHCAPATNNSAIYTFDTGGASATRSYHGYIEDYLIEYDLKTFFGAFSSLGNCIMM